MIWFKAERTEAGKVCDTDELFGDYELERLRIEAGFCRIGGESLFKKSSVTDGLGQPCMDCSRRRAAAGLRRGVLAKVLPASSFAAARLLGRLLRLYGSPMLRAECFPVRSRIREIYFPAKRQKFPATISREFSQKAQQSKGFVPP